METSTNAAITPSRRDRADAGVEGNRRLTAAAGMLLLVMLAIEGYTILDVRGMITLHIFLGIMLVGPVLLKVAATVYRFLRYYGGRPAYVRRGPPHLVLRVLGPLVTISSLAVLGTGLGLIWERGNGGLLLTAHQASFVVWVSVMTIHVLGHIQEAATVTWRELRQGTAGRRWRLAAVALALVVGLGGASALLPSAAHWTHRPAGFSRRHDH